MTNNLIRFLQNGETLDLLLTKRRNFGAAAYKMTNIRIRCLQIDKRSDPLLTN
jgi:hypothetical protein